MTEKQLKSVIVLYRDLNIYIIIYLSKFASFIVYYRTLHSVLRKISLLLAILMEQLQYDENSIYRNYIEITM